MDTRSRGPEAVRAALVEAATDLFARDGDASVRAVAARAGVNHGLVHHYFGGKSGLRTAVLDRLAMHLRESLDVPEGSSAREVSQAALRLTEQDPRMIRILARALLDGAPPQQLQSSFPVIERLLKASGMADPDVARAVLAEGLTLALGWIVFGPWVAAALGLGSKRVDLLRHEAMERHLDRLEDPR